MKSIKAEAFNTMAIVPSLCDLKQVTETFRSFSFLTYKMGILKSYRTALKAECNMCCHYQGRNNHNRCCLSGKGTLPPSQHLGLMTDRALVILARARGREGNAATHHTAHGLSLIH